MRATILFSSVSCLTIAGSLALQAQEAPSPSAPPLAAAASVQLASEIPSPQHKPSVNLVDVYFSVHDKRGYITNIQKDGCEIDEDKARQNIERFTLEENLPLTIGVLLGKNAGIRNAPPSLQDAAALLLKNLMRPNDKAFLMSFDSNVDLLADLTNSPSLIDHAIARVTATVRANSESKSFLGGVPSRVTLLYDAIYLAAHEELNQTLGRRVLVMVTDGYDRGSRNSLKTAVETAQKANTIVYVLLTGDKSFTDRRQAYSAMADMDRLARETGGRMIDIGSDERKVTNATTQIEHELRAQYLASYISTNDQIEHPFRRLQVRCDVGGKVQVQKAYYALAEGLGDE